MLLQSIGITLLAANQAHAWGSLAHRTVGYLAQSYFTPETAAWITPILDSVDRGDISDAAIWPDVYKSRMRWSAPWHYIDAQDDPPTTCYVNYKRDCGKGCIVSALINQTGIILDPSTSESALADALSFTLHFLGDIHQPLHTEHFDRGGNDIKVHFDSHTTNLHSVWDTAIPGKMRGLDPSHEDDSPDDEIKAAAVAWAGELYAASPTPPQDECTDLQDTEGCALQWAGEANSWICTYVLSHPLEWLESTNLSGDYYDGASPIVTDLVGKAGRRLGAWVNALHAQVAQGSSKIDL